MSCGVGPFNRLRNRETAAAVYINANENETGDWIEMSRTIDSAAFVDRNVGLGFSSLGAGGGGAAVWGAEASGDIDGRLGTTVVGEFGRAGGVL